MWSSLAEDLAVYARSTRLSRRAAAFFFSPGFQLLALYRLGRTMRRALWLRPLSVPLAYLMRMLYGCELSLQAHIGRRLRLAHPLGVVIGAGVVLGDEVTLFQNVTLGSHGRGGQKGYPRVGNGVTVFAGAVIVGDVIVGDDAAIGALSFVTHDVAAETVVAGSPARQIGTWSRRIA